MFSARQVSSRLRALKTNPVEASLRVGGDEIFPQETPHESAFVKLLAMAYLIRSDTQPC